MATQKTVVVLGGPTGPTGTIEGVNILSAFTGATGQFRQWLQATGASGPTGLLKRVYNIGPTGISGAHKNVIISGFSANAALTWKFGQLNQMATVADTYFTSNNASAALSTEYRFANNNSAGASVSATLAAWAAGAKTVDFTTAQGDTLTIVITGLGTFRAGYTTFAVSSAVAAGTFSFNEIFTGVAR